MYRLILVTSHKMFGDIISAMHTFIFVFRPQVMLRVKKFISFYKNRVHFLRVLYMLEIFLKYTCRTILHDHFQEPICLMIFDCCVVVCFVFFLTVRRSKVFEKFFGHCV